eukprot:GFYU01010040.1.p1 GENE.GFYU01010040.1~~GFYU01010040.1.p1  ORF type:complete len:332 (+),score=104.82 GFYU01010040.1:25-996(+)
MANGPRTTVQFWETERKESIYQSTKTEPLGRSFSRHHKMPDQVTDPNFRFGVTSSESVSAKNLLFPTDIEEPENPPISKYNIPYLPGEQVRRDYNWDSAGIDPRAFRFGAIDPDRQANGAKASMTADPSNPTVVTNKRLEDYKHTTRDGLGKTANLGARDYNMPDDHVYGVPSKGLEEWGAKECLTGQMTAKDLHDEDLGRSTKPGCRNFTDTTRVFGVPSIRHDVPAPKIKSVADNQNYGGEPDGKSLLYPSAFTSQGVTEEDFCQDLPPQELKEIMLSAGIVQSEGEFEKVYQQTARRFGQVTVASFKNQAMSNYILTRGR